jgi:exosortase K
LVNHRFIIAGDDHGAAKETVVSMSRRTIWGAQLITVLLCALALKFFYSTATPDELRWILAPTTLLVSFLSGKSFEFESLTGYMSSDHTFVIAAPCAGVNFLITSFVMLCVMRLWRDRFQSVSWRFIPLAALVAYASTLVANTTRIWIALHTLKVRWLTGNQVHRLEGIVVYFGFLLLLFVLMERAYSVKQLLVPLFLYYAVTLGIPLITGNWQLYAAFWEHFAFVLAFPLVLTGLAGLAKRSGGPCGCRSPRTLRYSAARWYGGR